MMIQKPMFVVEYVSFEGIINDVPVWKVMNNTRQEEVCECDNEENAIMVAEALNAKTRI